MVIPRCCHHAGLVLLHLPQGPRDHVADTVDKADGKGRAAIQLKLHCLLRHKLRLRCHDSPAGAALRQLIPGPLLAVNIVDAGNDLCFHEPLDKGGLSCSHRPHNTDINIPGGAGGNILIDRGIHSIPSFSHSIVLLQSMSQQ